ncbi:MAG: type II secretion system F family protein [Sulfurospirillum sp.]|nr:MAG: type II secretion system F family protein [Sulfurospirillum sp.]
MKYFEVNYIQKGKRGSEVIKAVSRQNAILMAKARIPNGTVLKAYEISAPLEERFADMKESIFGAMSSKKIKVEALIAAFRQLAVMTNAGISIHDSIREVTKATVDKDLKAIFEQIDEDLNAGKSLTESMMPYKYQVGDITIAMIELGENTGNMSESLTKLSEVLEEMMENAKKLKSAMRYPTTVIVAIAVAFTILMMYVVPKFKEIFEKLGADLPMPTKVLLFLEHALNTYGLYILMAIIATVVYHKYLYKTNDDYKRKVDKYILKVYLIGNVIFFASMNRFMLIFTELVRAGIPIAEALDTAVITIDNEEIKDKLAMVKTAVERGANLTEAFEETELFEGMLIQMIKAGESGGALDKMLEKVSDYYANRFNDIIENLSAYIEPILIGFIAGMVLMLALGIFLPMWDMASAVKN